MSAAGMKPAVVCGVAGGALALGFALGRIGGKPSQGGKAVDAARGKVETELIDGKAIAADVRSEVKEHAQALEREHGVRPGLAVILVGTRKDSQSYVRNKKKAASEVNFHTVDVDLPETVSQKDLLKEVEKLNNDPKVHAILVQLPLPKHIDEATVLKAIRVDKDADGFSAVNIGNLCLKGGDPPMAVPCTPAGCIELIQRSGVEVSGKRAVVIGRSNIVGMPVSQLLQSMDATVTVCHSRTKDMASYIKEADIVVAAIGKAEFVRGEWLKPGCTVIDVGINPVEDATKKLGHRLVGDVNFAEAKGVAAKITPVPGGVGPMTIAMLLKNTLNLARHSLGLPRLPLRKNARDVAVAPPAAQAAKHEAMHVAAGAEALPAVEDVAVVVSCKGGDIWQAAVQASPLRQKIQELAGKGGAKSRLPSVVLQAARNGDRPVAVVGLGGGPPKVLCSAGSIDEAAALLEKR
mmetsp:Transcript_82714/g.162240  ORF Transcript_82714/g.162240 Transcript_82714/m.162240 type:complete len:464 (+) Transcript_82714:52-1443(+)